MAGNDVITWRIVGSALAIMLLTSIGVFWSGHVGGITELRHQVEKERESNAAVQRKVDVIEERTKRTEQDVQEIKDTQKEQGRKLDELLRRTPGR